MRVWKVVGIAVAAMLTVASSASAVIVKLPDGKTLSYMPTAARAAGLPKPLDTVFSNVDYNGGPVMPSNTNYLIFWKPSGTSAFPSEYASGIGQYFTDLAAASGGHTDTDSIAAQYNDTAGDFAAYASTYGGAFLDSQAYPASACGAGAAPSGNPCVTDGQIQAELERFVAANSLPEDLTHEYFVLFPPHVVTCFDSNPGDGCDVNANPQFAAYCAYHGNTPYTPGNPVVVYAVQPYVVGANVGCDDGQYPNGPSDGAIEGGLSHEHLESITDPIPNTAWTDFDDGGEEIADKCVNDYGTQLGTKNGYSYNQVINGDDYEQQEVWSNSGHSCMQFLSATPTPPTAAFTISPGGPDTADVDASASSGPIADYHWEFEDPSAPDFPAEDEKSTPTDSYTYPSGGPHTISLTVYESDGTGDGTSQQVAFPVATFTDDAVHPLPGQAVGFDGTGSTSANPGPLSYSWNFGDGSPPTGGPTPTHVYAAPGDYEVSLTVTDGKGFSDVASEEVEIFSPPVAGFTVSPSVAAAENPVRFDGAPSSSAGASITGYRWSFGDGSSATGATPVHTYAAPGLYLVQLTVTDNFGDVASTQQEILVHPPPVARIAVKTRHPATRAPVSFSSAASSDPAGTIVAYSWRFGDGRASAAADPTHTYARRGTYHVTLTVTDASGNTAVTTASVTVVRASKIAKLSLRRIGAGLYLLVKVTGAGTVKLGSKSVRLKKAGTARFQVSPGGGTRLEERVEFVPVAGPRVRKTSRLTVPPE